MSKWLQTCCILNIKIWIWHCNSSECKWNLIKNHRWGQLCDVSAPVHKHLSPGWHWECWCKKSKTVSRRGNANLSTPPATQYIICFSDRLLPYCQDFSKHLSILNKIHHQNWKYLSQASLLEDASHQMAQVIKNKKGRVHYSLWKLLVLLPASSWKVWKKTTDRPMFT